VQKLVFAYLPVSASKIDICCHPGWKSHPTIFIEGFSLARGLWSSIQKPLHHRRSLPPYPINPSPAWVGKHDPIPPASSSITLLLGVPHFVVSGWAVNRPGPAYSSLLSRSRRSTSEQNRDTRTMGRIRPHERGFKMNAALAVGIATVVISALTICAMFYAPPRPELRHPGPVSCVSLH
jgi:hypothetical protein